MRSDGPRLMMIVLFALGAPACKESTKLGDTGLPEDVTVSSLMGDDWQTFCKAVDAARRKPPEEECARLAFADTRTVADTDGTDADVRATCQARYDACMREVRPRASSICGFGPVGPDCSATVGEAELCLQAGLTRRREDAAKIPSCATVTAAQAKATAGTAAPNDAEILLLPACVTFQEKCPGLLR